MSKGGLIIRLIDVVLILLLGFIGISDFTVKTQVKLPQGANESNTPVEKKVVVFVRILKNQTYEIEDGKQKLMNVAELKEVEEKLVELQNEHGNLVAIIEPDLDTMIQLTIDLIDICEKNNIQKSINYEI
jgi:biopolymer transport protein ExbD